MKENKWLYKAEFKGMQGFILESRGGAKSSIAQRNPDYKLLLQYVLETLKNGAIKNVEIYIASTRETKYPNVSDRLLSIDGKSKFDFARIDVSDFIKKLSNEIRLSGQTGTEKGGNSTKRLFFHVNEEASSIIPTASMADKKNENSSLKEEFLKALEKFDCEFNRPKKNNDAILKVLVSDLQSNLKNYLETTFGNFAWQTEYQADLIRKDSFDIYGYDKANNMHVVIELDPHRADSIAKKFVSRMALMVDKNLLYVAFVYPGTDKMPKNEANKYLLDCETLLNVLDANSGIKKEFLGFYLKK